MSQHNQIDIPQLVKLHGVVAYSKSVDKIKRCFNSMNSLSIVLTRGTATIPYQQYFTKPVFDDIKTPLEQIQQYFSDELKLLIEQTKQVAIDEINLDKANLAALLKSDVYLEILRLQAKYKL